MGHGVALQLVIVVALGALFVALCQHFRWSPILGYLATGVLVGPSALDWLPDASITRRLAEFGAVLLLFIIGLEFSLPRLLAAKRLVVGVGGAQVALTTSLFALAAWWLGLSSTEAFVLGGGLALSSAAIVVKQLGGQMELGAPHGRVVMAILLFQAIAAVALLVALPILATRPDPLIGALALALVKAALVFVSLTWVGRRLLPAILHRVAATHSRELFMLSALLLALSAAAVSAIVGLSLTIGAFMAGMLLGETRFRHLIEVDIGPFRDLLLGLFFATIGMQIDAKAFVDAPAAVALVLTGLLVVKPAILVPLVRGFGQTGTNAWRASISLAQGGEFGLLVVSSALALGVFTEAVAQPVLGGLILSMLAAPILLRFNRSLAAALALESRTSLELDVEAHIAETSRETDRHVVVCGYGRLGQNLVRMLAAEGIPALALDLDPERVRQAAAAGEPVLVRSSRGRDADALSAAGTTVFPEGLEKSLAFAGQLLIMLGMPPSQVETRLKAIRAKDYAPLRVFFHGTADPEAGEEAQDYPEQVQAVIVGEGHHAAGRTPQELCLGKSGVELLDVRRGAIPVTGRLLDTRLQAGDVLRLKGSCEALERAIAGLTEGA